MAPAETSGVVELGTARERLRLSRCRARIELVIAQNREAIETLCTSGMLFTRAGAGAGRDLLDMHQQLLRMGDALGRAERGLESAPMPACELDALFLGLEGLLEETGELARRNRSLFSRPGR